MIDHSNTKRILLDAAVDRWGSIFLITVFLAPLLLLLLPAYLFSMPAWDVLGGVLVFAQLILIMTAKEAFAWHMARKEVDRICQKHHLDDDHSDTPA